MPEDSSPENRPTRKSCEHGLPWLRPVATVPGSEAETVCALEYLNRFVAPNRVERLDRRGRHLYLVFGTGEKLECCCESCGESHGDDREFTQEIEEVALGRRALRFRLEGESGHLVVWFARGDHLHIHRNALLRFRPPRKSAAARSSRGRRARTVRPTHNPAAKS